MIAAVSVAVECPEEPYDGNLQSGDVDLRFRTEVDGAGLEDRFDLVVAADGVNSTLRRRHADATRIALIIRPFA